MRNCPLCDSKNYELLYTQQFADHFSHDICSCKKCGFVFVRNTPAQKYYDEYYRKMSKYEGVRGHESHYEETYKVISSFMKKNIKKTAHILDIGCSSGYLLWLLKKLGYKNVYGFDPAPACKNIAKEKYGIAMETAEIENFTTEKKYDFIILSQVLEHLRDVQKSIEKITSFLSDDGYFFIGVPDTGRFHEDFEEPFGEFSTEHINFFSESSLYQLMKHFTRRMMHSDKKALLSVWQKDSEGKRSMRQYIQKSQAKMDHIESVIKSIPKNTIVWGAGALTQRLLLTTNIKSKIYKFVDRNKNLIGKKLEGIEIISPETLHTYSNPVLISSFRFKDEIKQFMKEKKYKNRIFTFSYS